MDLQPKISDNRVTEAFIGYGSNLSNEHGKSHNLVEAAIDLLSRKHFRVLQTSGHFRSPAFPPGAGPDFVNGILRVSTDLSATQALAALHEIECELGRTRLKRWEARVIDLDLIDFGGQVLPDPETQARWRRLTLAQQQTQAPDVLILPHPRLQDRSFVLVPMQVVAPDWVHPVTGHSVAGMIAALDAADVASVTPLDTDPATPGDAGK